jgi:5-methylthioadenosine/S-adenosylhomocysteine deaminase
MMNLMQMHRRGFMRGVAALGAASAFTSTGFAQPSPPQLPARGEFVIRNAYVMTMDIAGDIVGGSVHVRNGDIVAVDKDIAAPNARVIEGAGMIVLPGLIETHWHMWNTLFRSFAGESKDEGYFPTVARLGTQMLPDDLYHGTRLAAAEAINSGITTVHDWCHNVRSREHAEADIGALQQTGIRARFSYGWPQGLPDTQIMDVAGLEATEAEWAKYSSEGLIALGLAWRGMVRAGPIPPDVYRKEFDTARRLGIPITVHAGSASSAKGQIAALAKENLLGKDVQVIHAVAASADEIKMMADSGCALSVSPGSEQRIGFGFAPVSEFMAAGIPLGVSIDTDALVGDANLFAVLKMTRNAENARALSEFKMTARTALELGTIRGARSMGIDGKVGSIKAGKRADLVMINTRALNMAVFTDPAHLVVECTMPENVDTVVVDGRVLKEGGKLAAVNVPQVVADAAAAFEAVRKRTAWR